MLTGTRVSSYLMLHPVIITQADLATPHLGYKRSTGVIASDGGVCTLEIATA